MNEMRERLDFNQCQSGLAGMAICALVISSFWTQKVSAVEPAANGIQWPADYKTWQVVSVSHRTDKSSLRVILGNPTAIRAARGGSPLSWPNGTTLAKVVWQEKTHEQWPAAIVPGELVHVEFMVKDAQKFAATGGWGYARWLGSGLTPYGKDPAFAQECVDCHTRVKDQDYVFTKPPLMP